MSENKKVIEKQVVSGVIKVDWTAAGYPDMRKIAESWSKDPHFYEIIVRNVSEKNFGIQFLYISEDISVNNFQAYYDELKKRFDKDMYAVDIQWSNGDANIKELIDMHVITLKPYLKEKAS